MRRSRRVAPTLVALVAGGLQAVSMAAPWNGQPLWWLQLLSLALLGWQLKRCADRELSWSSSTWTGNADRPSTVAQAGWLGWVFGCSWLTGTFWWLYISMHTYGGLAAPLAAAAVLGLAAVLALYYALACAIFMAILRPIPHVNSGFRAILFAALWTVAELARGSWFTGFPWGAGGYAHTDGLLAGYAPWLGVYGLGAVAAWVGMTLPRLLHCGVASRVALVFLLALPSVVQVGNAASTRATGTLAVTLLQGNIPQDEKFQPGTGVPQALKWYGEQLRNAKTPLVVGPETAVPLLPQQLPEGYWAALQQRFASGNQAALLGVPLGDITVGYTNSVVGLKPGQAEPYRYDKHHLVPFGEFIPPLFKWFTAMMNIPLGDFNRGELGAPSFEWQGQRLAPNICYEDLFGEELATRFADPSTAPTILVNLSNIGWFGNTVAIDQHLQISRMRALEFERPMLRATNTGPTVFIDHRGQVTRELPRLSRGVLLGEVEGRSGLTPYARWVSRLGLWPLWALAGVLVGLALLVRRRN